MVVEETDEEEKLSSESETICGSSTRSQAGIDAWQKLLSQLSLKDMTLGTFGTHLQSLLKSAPSHLGEVARLIQSWKPFPFSSAIASQHLGGKDVYPLPVIDLSAEDVKALQAHHELGPFSTSVELWSLSHSAVTSRLRYLHI